MLEIRYRRNTLERETDSLLIGNIADTGEVNIDFCEVEKALESILDEFEIIALEKFLIEIKKQIEGLSAKEVEQYTARFFGPVFFIKG